MGLIKALLFTLLVFLVYQVCAIPLIPEPTNYQDFERVLLTREDLGTNAVINHQFTKRSSSYVNSQREPLWMSEPRVRGTFRLVLSSLITYLLCVWTTIHVNVEPPPDTPRLHHKILPFKKGGYVDALLRLRVVRKIGWGAVSLILPEFTMWIAYYELQVAKRLCKKLTEIHEKEKSVTAAGSSQSAEECEKITRSGTEVRQTKSSSEEFDEIHYNPRKLKLGFYGVMGGFVLDPNIANRLREKNLLSEEDAHRVTLTPLCIIACAEIGCLPKISIAAINDKSNADALAKFLICIQVGWMLIQVIGRAITGLPITLLELHIVLQCACAVTMYALWWDKPLDIHLPTTVFMTEEQEKKFIERYKQSMGSSPGRKVMIVDPTCPIPRYVEDKLLTSSCGLGKLLYEHLFEDSEEGLSLWEAFYADFTGIHRRVFAALGSSSKVSAALCILNIVWGALHLVAWNSDFPTAAERILWRVASTFTTAVLVAELIYIPMGQLVKDDKSFFGKCYWNMGWFLWLVGFLPGVVLRGVLAVQGFVCIRDLPKGSYDTVVWAEMLPHY